MPETVHRKMAHTSTGSVFCSWIELLGDKACRGEARGGRPSGCRMACKTKRLALPGGRCAGHGRTAGGAVPRRRGAAACPRWSDRAQVAGGVRRARVGGAPARGCGSGGHTGAGIRAARNARGSLARSVHGKLGSARIGSFKFFSQAKLTS
jgi:hypothetical protein